MKLRKREGKVTQLCRDLYYAYQAGAGGKWPEVSCRLAQRWPSLFEIDKCPFYALP
jgi:hypothetical protein